MGWRFWVMGGALLVSSVGPAVAAETAWAGIVVRVYDSARTPEATTAAALDLASRTLSPAGVDVAWAVCRSQPARCQAPPPRGELLLRLVRTASREDGAVLPLGDALVGDAGGAGVLATVYVDRVQRLAETAGADVRTLLGRAIAHELGHLLMGQRAHGARGLMRPLWTREEVRRGAAADWRFAPSELMAIRQRRAGF